MRSSFRVFSNQIRIDFGLKGTDFPVDVASLPLSPLRFSFQKLIVESVSATLYLHDVTMIRQRRRDGDDAAAPLR